MSIILAGAGPGDPELLTIAAMKALENAELVVSDRLVHADILAFAKCEVKIALKTTGRSDPAQDELSEWCLEGLGAGKRVVRLKIGDPFVFGRGGEEVLWYRERGFECQIIPGICSALAGPLEVGIPVTHRGASEQVLICTGRGRNGTYPNIPEYDPARTIVILMGVGRLGELSAMLIKDKQFPSSTPVNVVQSATTPEMKQCMGTLQDIEDKAKQAEVKAPAVITIGGVVDVLRPVDTVRD
ncbi:uroporphyrin-III C-methyltransferase, variant [Sphaeroforma arctica JP610]|uniref:Uroporphyrin-III C-methyltransferase, variant n=1 Tax=Sphaeroforma arctica JP610 TaxID=667725 RepID=A0A0L0G5Z9_9EUKA|nr:uroporphyrin-III C-methyltransferase, variant [Sphaeroforma arctica JP610]KNC83638.1 uroporphyrin-III C-methyltransferase, variant [Sphaeroforma arctica JP610]|eukprot:XP_014157541.1 uroporphyrin-III C-methyltransferase, variant [Sphaeroforma arctica JP610]